jgi:hypothetical protein
LASTYQMGPSGGRNRASITLRHNRVRRRLAPVRGPKIAAAGNLDLRLLGDDVGQASASQTGSVAGTGSDTAIWSANGYRLASAAAREAEWRGELCRDFHIAWRRRRVVTELAGLRAHEAPPRQASSAEPPDGAKPVRFATGRACSPCVSRSGYRLQAPVFGQRSAAAIP